MITQKEYDLKLINAIDYLNNNGFVFVGNYSDKIQYSYSTNKTVIHSKTFKILNDLNIKYFIHKTNNKIFLNLYRKINW